MSSKRQEHIKALHKISILRYKDTKTLVILKLVATVEAKPQYIMVSAKIAMALMEQSKRQATTISNNSLFNLLLNLSIPRLNLNNKLPSLSLTINSSSLSHKFIHNPKLRLMSSQTLMLTTINNSNSSSLCLQPTLSSMFNNSRSLEHNTNSNNNRWLMLSSKHTSSNRDSLAITDEEID